MLILYYHLIVGQSIEIGINSYKLDSLEKSKKIFTEIFHNEESTDKANAAYYLAGIYQKQDSLVLALKWGFEALSRFTVQEDKEMQTKSNLRIYGIEYKAQNYPHAVKSAHRSIATSPDGRWYHLSQYNLGLAQLRLQQYDSALINFTSSYDYFVKEGDHPWVCRTLNEIALVYYYVGNYVKARKHYFDLLDFSQSINNEKYIGNALNNIGNAYLKEGKEDSASIYLTKALPHQNYRDKLTTYLNLAKVTADPVPYLLLAKNHYQNSLDINDYVDILHLLSLHHTNADSVSSYVSELAGIAVTQSRQYAQVESYTKRLELEHTEVQLELQRAKREQQEQRNFYARLIIGVIAGSVVLILLVILMYKKKWLPEWAAYKIDLLTYQKSELQKTIKQILES